MKVCLFGATGFVGSAVGQALRRGGSVVTPMPTPRLVAEWGSALIQWPQAEALTGEVAEAVRGADVVVNCAGIANPWSRPTQSLYGANALLPVLLSRASRLAGAHRFIHISSAAVQGDRNVLDETEDVSPTTSYALSKACAERMLLCEHREGLAILRPTSVHGLGRPTTVRLARFARSSLSSVAGSGDWASPQVLVQNVGIAVAFLATHGKEPPALALQPSENHTARSILRLLSLGQEPRHIPVRVANGVLALTNLGLFDPRVGAARRRLKMLWFGQRQVRGWLASQGLAPASVVEEWTALAQALATVPLS